MNKKVTTEYVLCVFGGVFGLHKFYNKDYKKGFLYLFTLGLFLIGWIRDVVILYKSLPVVEELEGVEVMESIEQPTMSKRQLRKERLRQLKEERMPYCPKCKSTSIQYVERRKRLSIGRGIVGNVVAGPVWGVVGTVTSNKHKGRVKCLNCGKTWKR